MCKPIIEFGQIRLYENCSLLDSRGKRLNPRFLPYATVVVNHHRLRYFLSVDRNAENLEPQEIEEYKRQWEKITT
jgi:hypothetical protein